MAHQHKHTLQRLITLFARYQIPQRAIAQQLGVTESTVSSWWHGRTSLPEQHYKTLERWGLALKSSPPPPPQAKVRLPLAIEKAIAGFQEHLMIDRRLAPATQAVYGATAHQFFTAWQRKGRIVRIALVTPKPVIEYLAERREQGISARTTARILAALRAFDRWLAQERLRPARALADMQIRQPPRSLPHALSREDIERLLQQPSRTSPRGLRDLAMLEVLYGSGLRAAELVNLPMSAVHLMEGWLKIRGKGGRERIVPMGQPEMAALHAYLGKPREALLGSKESPYVFISQQGRPMSRQNLWKLLCGYADEAGISKAVSPHTLRHSFATHLLEGGADILSISHLMGHGDLKTTEIYAHVAPVHLQEAYQRFHPRA
jgi:integrase/recombinase XerD